MSNITKVVFHKFNDGSIIAIFPYDVGTSNPYTCDSYQSIGQHGACDPMLLVEDTTLATQSEYAALQEELESIGYELNVMQRISHRAALRARQNEIRRIEEIGQ